MPELFCFVKSCRIEQRSRQRRIGQRPLLFFWIESDTNMKQRAWLDPVRYGMM